MELYCKVDKVEKIGDGSRLILYGVDYDSQKKIESYKSGDYLRLNVTKPKDKRTLEQNRLLWALIDDIAKQTSMDDMEIYCEALEQAGEKYSYYAIPPYQIDEAKETFRAIKVLNEVDVDGCIYKFCKCYVGSSKYDTKEIQSLIEQLYKMAGDAGLELKYYG